MAESLPPLPPVLAPEALGAPARGVVLEVRQHRALDPVILIPGYCEPLFLFAAIAGHLQEAGFEAIGMDEHFPAIWDIRVSAERLAEKVESVLATTGASHVDLVSHSLGGLMARYYIKFLGGAERVARCVTLATPHHGTYVAHLWIDWAARQMRPGSEFLTELNDGEEAFGPVRYTSIYSRMDQLIIPQDSAHLHGASNHALLFGFHNQMMFTAACMRHIREALGTPVAKPLLLN